MWRVRVHFAAAVSNASAASRSWQSLLPIAGPHSRSTLQLRCALSRFEQARLARDVVLRNCRCHWHNPVVIIRPRGGAQLPPPSTFGPVPPKSSSGWLRVIAHPLLALFLLRFACSSFAFVVQGRCRRAVHSRSEPGALTPRLGAYSHPHAATLACPHGLSKNLPKIGVGIAGSGELVVI